MTALDQTEALPTTRRLGRLVLLFLAHAVGTANITLVLAMAPAVERALAIGHAEFGLMVASYYSALLLAGLPAGWLVDRIGLGPGLIIAHAVLAAGMLILAGAQSLLTACPGLALCGIGYSLVNPATARGVMLWFPARGRATAMGAKQTGVPAGAIAASLAAAAVGGDAWREIALAVVVVTLIAGLSYIALGRTRPESETAVSLSDLRHVLGHRQLRIFNAGAFLYATSQAAFFAYLVLFAHEALALEPATASLCLALAHIASAIGRVAWGMAGDLIPRNGRRTSLTICGIVAAVGLATLAILPGLGGLAALMPISVMLGFTLGGYAGLAQAAAVEMAGLRLVGAAIGYNMLLTISGSMLGPALFGHAIERVGYAPAWIAAMALMAGGACLFVLALRRETVQAERVKS